MTHYPFCPSPGWPELWHQKTRRKRHHEGSAKEIRCIWVIDRSRLQNGMCSGKVISSFFGYLERPVSDSVPCNRRRTFGLQRQLQIQLGGEFGPIYSILQQKCPLWRSSSLFLNNEDLQFFFWIKSRRGMKLCIRGDLSRIQKNRGVVWTQESRCTVCEDVADRFFNWLVGLHGVWEDAESVDTLFSLVNKELGYSVQICVSVREVRCSAFIICCFSVSHIFLNLDEVGENVYCGLPPLQKIPCKWCDCTWLASMLENTALRFIFPPITMAVVAVGGESGIFDGRGSSIMMSPMVLLLGTLAVVSMMVT